MDNLQPGQQLGPYRILGQVGQGGMATVYKAYHAAMDRYVAIKVLPRQLADNAEFLGRFQQEARIIANLEHPHILPVHDYGESEGITYLVMRYLDTGTLKDWLQGRTLTLAEIDRCFGQLVDALEYAHAHGVIHRDLKPSNVLVDARGNLFLTDFGIAKLLESSSQFTGTGALIGTPDYMSPEQAQGLRVDQRADIYSLGIILYELVTGRVPFEAETPLAVILKHLNDPLPLPTTLKPDLSPAIERVLLKALAKAPDDRFASAEEFHTAWKAALAEIQTLHVPPPAATILAATVTGASPLPAAGATVLAVPPVAPATPPAAPPAPRRKWPLWALVGVGVVGLAVALGGMVLAARWLAVPALPPTTVAATAVPSEGAPASPAPAAPWTSWGGSNHLWSVIVKGDEIVAGGRGLTLWNRNSGALLNKFVGPPDGLPDALVNALLVGDGGALWVATESGVGVYDGKRWTKYTPQDGLDSLTVSALTRLPEGVVAGTQWSGADGGGLNVFTPDGIKPVAGFPSAAEDRTGAVSVNITALLTLPDQKISWVGTQHGLARYDLQSKKWTLYFQADGLPHDHINTLGVDDGGALWVGTPQGAARFTGERFEPVERLKDANVLGIVSDGQGNLWFACEGALERYTPPSGGAPAKWDRYTQDDTPGLNSLSYYTAVKDEAGRLYFGSDNGLVRYADSKFATWAVPNAPGYGAYRKILPAPDGDALWFVEQNGGPHVDRFDRPSEGWSLAPNLPESGTPLVVAADKTVWCGGFDGLTVVAADGHQTHVTTDQGLPSNEVTAIQVLASGKAWLGTADKGVAEYDGQKISQVFDVAQSGLTSDAVSALLAARDGSLWIGTTQGLDHYTSNGQWEHYTLGNVFASGFDHVSSLAEGADGAIWVSTQGEGNLVHRWAGGQWTQFVDGEAGVKLPGDFVQAITAAPDGSLWFGSYYHGAARFDGKAWTLYTTTDGLVNANVTDIYVEKTGVVWFATSGGITRFMP